MNYQELKDALANLTPEQLQQDVQVMISRSSLDKTIPLHLVEGLDTVHHYICPPDSNEEQEVTRCFNDNEHHPEQLVLLVIENMFSEDGVIAHDLFTGEKIYGARKKNVDEVDEFKSTFGDI